MNVPALICSLKWIKRNFIFIKNLFILKFINLILYRAWFNFFFSFMLYWLIFLYLRGQCLSKDRRGTAKDCNVMHQITFLPLVVSVRSSCPQAQLQEARQWHRIFHWGCNIEAHRHRRLSLLPGCKWMSPAGTNNILPSDQIINLIKKKKLSTRNWKKK